MSDEQAQSVLQAVSTRLRYWKIAWNTCFILHFSLGSVAVLFSSLAAMTDAHAWYGVVSAVCVALIGFLRPEARYHNAGRAWRQLDYARDRFVILKEITAGELLATMTELEEMVMSDERNVPEPTKYPDISQRRKPNAK